jgi:Flp pilus assembly protein TadD
MHRGLIALMALAFGLVFAVTDHAQIDDICREAGASPSLDSPFAHVPYVFGKISLTGFDGGTKPPKVTVIFWDREQSETRLNIDGSGNYCFKRNNASGGLLVVEVNGVEAIRRSLPTFGPAQQREDFEITSTGTQLPRAPGTISAKFNRPRNEKTVDLYSRATAAEQSGDSEKAVRLLKEIVTLDPQDFVAWAKLGTLLFERKLFADADAAFRKSLELKVDYTPAWINVGNLRVAQMQFEAAAEIYKHALSLEPNSARIYRSLGEAYLQARKGTLGAAALNKAIELDPIGMAECHLVLARLYDLAGAKNIASREYSAFLAKVKEHPNRQKFEKYIKENSEK